MNFKKILKYIIWILLILFIINVSTTAVYLSLEPGLPTDENNGRNNLSFYVVLIMGVIAFGCEFYKLSNRTPKNNSHKPNIDEVDSSQVCDSNESTPVVTKVLDDMDPQKLNIPKPPHVPLDKGPDYFDYFLIASFTFLILYICYLRNILGFKSFIETKIISKINKNHVLWRHKHLIIVLFQFLVTLLTLYF